MFKFSLYSLFAVVLIHSSCSSSKDLSRELYLMRENGKWGYINDKGEIVIQPTYDCSAQGYTEDCSRSFTKHAIIKLNEKFGLIDNKGKTIIAPQYEGLSIGSQTLAAKTNDKWGIINFSNSVIFPFEFTSQYHLNFYNDTLAVGVIDTVACILHLQSRKIVRTRYSGISPFIEHIAYAKLGNRYVLIDEKGDAISDGIYGETSLFFNGLAAVEKDGLWGYIDKAGNYIIKPQFEAAESFYDSSQAVVELNGKNGVIDRSANFVIPPKYAAIYIQSEGFYEVNLPDTVTTPDTESEEAYEEGDAAYEDEYSDENSDEENDESTDEDNSETEEYESEEVDDSVAEEDLEIENEYNDDLDLVDKWGLINAKGEWIVPNEYEEISYYDGNATVKKDGRYGVLDIKTGAFFIPLEYTYIWLFTRDGLTLFSYIDEQTKEEKYGYFNGEGKIIWKEK